MKQIIITVLAVVAIIGGAVVLGKNNGSQTASTPSNNFYGAENGIVTLIEYGDFECPACGSYYPIVKQLKEEFKDELRFEYKHFPLVQIHLNATAAHRAAQAAANQGKFWEMHDMLYERQTAWSNAGGPSSIFEGYAQELGLDMDKYSNEVNSSETLAIINTDIEAGKAIGANSTPTFVLDGQIIDQTSITTVDAFRKLIQDAINEKKGVAGESDSETATEPSDSDTDPAATEEATSGQ